jgi:hypothetical protein
VSGIVGEAPTPEDDYWLSVASTDLAPDKSLQRISDKIGFIFTNLTLAGTVLAGAGIIAGVQARTREHPALLLAMIILVFASVAVALVANLPSMRSEINPSDPDAIRRYYEDTIRRKGWLTRFAILFFSAALILAFILVIGAANPDPTTQLSMQWASAGTGHSVALHATAQVAGLSGGSVGKMTVTGYRPDGHTTVLLRGVSTAQADGTLAFSADVKTAAAFRSVVLSVTVMRDHRQVTSRTMKLNV